MTPAERGFLLLGSNLSDPFRRPLTTAQIRVLAQRVGQSSRICEDRDMTLEDVLSLGYSTDNGQHILQLLSQEEALRRYLQGAEMAKCQPITRIHKDYPKELCRCLGWEAPVVLWAKGDISLLHTRKIGIVGSRDIEQGNAAFAEEVGRQAALQGFTLISGNARGADRLAQESCLRNGGNVICVVADALVDRKNQEHVLYLSEEDYDADFSPQRALSRNRVIHALGEKIFVAQCGLEKGGTWSGTTKNLRNGWSPVFCYQDGTDAVLQLEQMGAQPIAMDKLNNLQHLSSQFQSFFDQ